MKYDRELLDYDLLSIVREKYFSSNKKIRNKRFLYRGTSVYKYSYNISHNSPMKWRKLKNGVLVENSVPHPQGYKICTSDKDKIQKEIVFTNEHKLVKNCYYINPDLTEQISLKDDNTLVFETDNKNNKTQTLLYACKPIKQLCQRKKIFNSFGEPEVIAKTNLGVIYYCNEKLALKINNYEEQLLNPENPQESKSEDKTEHKNPISDKLSVFTSSNTEFTPNSEDNGFFIDFTQFPNYQTNTLKIKSGDDTFYYYGSVVDNKREGSGFTVTQTGKIAYNGQYKNNNRDGVGSYYYSDGNLCYFGNWKNNEKHGSGIQIYHKSKYFTVGKWHKGSICGECCSFDQNGDLAYFGNSKTDSNEGFGISNYKDQGLLFVRKNSSNIGTLFDKNGNMLYKGSFIKHKKDGFGTLYDDKEQILYVGHFKNDLYNGNGRLYLKDNFTIEAEFKDGIIVSPVIHRDPTGFIVYKGSWKNNAYNGYGCKYFKSGGRYEGNFKDGQPVGFLKGYNKHNECIYNGEWKDDKFCGQGTYYVKGEKFYSGAFENDTFNGNGFLYNKGKYIYAGGFLNGKREGWGTSYSDGKPLYSGEWKNNLYDGVGAVFKDNEIVMCGTFKQGNKDGRMNLIRNGMVWEEQLYENNKLVYTKKFNIKNPKSVYLLYMGNVSENLPNGLGCTFDKYGNIQEEGVFCDGELVKPMKVKFRDLQELPSSKYLSHTKYDIYRKSVNYVIDKQMPNGCIYTGMLDENNLPSGFATALYNDHIYMGQFLKGSPFGKGIIYMNDGSFVKGWFAKAQNDKNRELTFNNGVKYFCYTPAPSRGKKNENKKSDN